MSNAKNKRGKRFVKSLVIVVFVFFVLGVAFFLNQSFTGRVVSEIDITSESGQPIEGTLTLSLQEGELIPASSLIVVENGGEQYSYALNSLVSDSTVLGNFYAEGVSLSGEGEGYGIEGTKEAYPDVEFVLEVYSEKSSKEKTKSSGGAESSESVETQVEPDESELESSEVESEETEEQSSEEPIVLNGESVAEAVSESEESEPTESSAEPPSSPESSPSSPEESPAETSPSPPEPASSEPAAPSGITGAVVSWFTENVVESFFSLTGQVSLEFEQEVSGVVSADEPFVYELAEGQTAEIKSSSENVDIEINGNQVTVTTDYSVGESGFGADYVGEGEKSLLIDLSSMDFVPVDGELKVSLVYEGQEIVSVSSTIGGEVAEPEEAPEDETEVSENETVAENETISNVTNATVSNETAVNVTINETAVVLVAGLTVEEDAVLVGEFGNYSVDVTKAEIVGNKIVVRQELGDYWIENSYDNMDIDDVKEKIEEDKLNWLRDLVAVLSEEAESSQDISDLI